MLGALKNLEAILVVEKNSSKYTDDKRLFSREGAPAPFTDNKTRSVRFLFLTDYRTLAENLEYCPSRAGTPDNSQPGYLNYPRAVGRRLYPIRGWKPMERGKTWYTGLFLIYKTRNSIHQISSFISTRRQVPLVYQ